MAKTLADYLTEARSVVREVPPEAVDSLVEQGYKLLDVREPDEYRAEHPVGAINVSRGFLEVKADETHPKREPALQDRTQKWAVICAGGVRSLMAAKTLAEMGFNDPVSVHGGFAGWKEKNLPTE